ncbi:ABC-F family ATP-binding cassette domain-containing protein [Arcanobacterium hippocoleae]|uniref:ATPase subunit of ABC transporter with duplicated ATPase domains n=1 Tax=Arcanobacterium hippocoleae TaxID=149017 RepID=A0ABU1T3L8_9ACTO|nr:ABC-F family ATP-binding cassette domain-containing protein [Arcanobacterium hippocoleae]MDR6939851.1 ATPase subunit of ABC transporter with duplicated ATPase domains [Arcanobacterium hippocoleae]
MAHILNIEDVSITLGSRPILGQVNLSLADGSRIGVVGPNGGGKSTLLKLMMRQLTPENGRVTMAHGTRFSYLTQADSLDHEDPVEMAIHGDAQAFEWASQAEVREIHDGLIPDVPLTKKVGELSGGQRRRVALAAALCTPAEVLVLDEPTNHLDLEGVTYLAKYLQHRFARGQGALVVVTHDRWFLDAVCTQMWEVVPGDDGPGGKAPRPGHVEVYEGGYAAYILQRAERARLAQQAAEKRANLLRKELAWLRRGAPARTSKPKFRIEAANELIAAEPPPRDSLELAKMATARLGKDVIDLLNIDFSWPNATSPTLQDVTLRLAPGERIGILGRNGAGKSSLLGLLNGTLEPNRGKIKHGQTVKLATLSQETKELDEIGHRRVVESVQDIATHVIVGKHEVSAGQLVERLGFTRERAWTRVAELSGGERRRLQLLRLLVSEPNVLLLDEPTNDLDTDTLAAIEDLLDSWPGTLIVVSHDRYLLERITDHQIAVINGSIRDLPRGVDEYLELSAALDLAAAKHEDTKREDQAQPAIENDPATDARITGARTKDAARERLARKSLARAERRIAKLNQQKAQLGAAQTELAMSGDYEKLAEIGREIAQIDSQIADLESEWLEAAEEVEHWS